MLCLNLGIPNLACFKAEKEKTKRHESGSIEMFDPVRKDVATRNLGTVIRQSHTREETP